MLRIDKISAHAHCKKGNRDDGEKYGSICGIELYREYVTWCEQNGERQKTGKQFGLVIKTVFKSKRTNKGMKYIVPEPVAEPEEAD